jgi:hypothetical protein
MPKAAFYVCLACLLIFVGKEASDEVTIRMLRAEVAALITTKKCVVPPAPLTHPEGITPYTPKPKTFYL